MRPQRPTPMTARPARRPLPAAPASAHHSADLQPRVAAPAAALARDCAKESSARTPRAACSQPSPTRARLALGPLPRAHRSTPHRPANTAASRRSAWPCCRERPRSCSHRSRPTQAGAANAHAGHAARARAAPSTRPRSARCRSATPACRLPRARSKHAQQGLRSLSHARIRRSPCLHRTAPSALRARRSLPGSRSPNRQSSAPHSRPRDYGHAPLHRHAAPCAAQGHAPLG